ncbi:MAG: serine hydrolase [Candidatus Promineifilaceae bacterium]
MTHFPDTDAIQEMLQAYVDKYQKGVGLIVGLISPAGTEFISYGRLHVNRPDPVRPDTLFEIGSVSKIFTALLLADMAAQGEVALDDPIGRFLPPTVKTPTYQGQPITLFHLATHTSGLPRNDNDHTSADGSNPYSDYTVEQLYQFLSTYDLPHSPGSAAAYSNLGFGLLGHILGLKAGLSYDQLVRQRIGQPLHMPDTMTTLSAEQAGRLAQPHNVVREPVSYWTMPTLAGAGALRSTAADLLQFVGGSLGLVDSSLTPVMQQMVQTHYLTGEPNNKKRPLGWGIETKYSPHVIVADGGTGGSRAFIGFVPEKQIGVVVLCNVATDDNYFIGLNLLEPRFELPQWQLPRQEMTLTAEQLEPYLGRYAEQDSDDVYEVTREGNQLFVQILGEGRYPVFAGTPSEFFYKIADAQHVFLRDHDGRVTHMLTHQFGKDRLARRVE